ncbi:MAG TPA: cysteine desulfurase, partial [Planctomycetes bacterium]|nr:cysteine desulfurase [Planctomycetota bacterium]
LGLEAIQAHLQAYHDALEPALQELGWRSLRAPDPAARSGTLSFEPPAGVDVVAVPERLAAQGVAVTIPDGRLRLSPHWPNALEEVERVVDALRA